MATINKAGTLTKAITVINLMSDADNKGVSITPMLNGPHGIGKSQGSKTSCWQYECILLHNRRRFT